MKLACQIAGGSIPGRNHLVSDAQLLIGTNNHDAFLCCAGDDVSIVAVGDGCGSRLHSECGAKWGVRRLIVAMLREFPRFAAAPEAFDDGGAFWTRVRSRLLRQLWFEARQHTPPGGSVYAVLGEYFYFTLVGALITPQSTYLFSVRDNDGYYGLNGSVTALPAARKMVRGKETEMPAYLAYALMETEEFSDHPGLGDLVVHAQAPTAEVRSAFVGSDGLRFLIAAERSPLPAETELVGPLSQFWEQDRYFKNPENIMRRLRLIGGDRWVIDPGLRRMLSDRSYLREGASSAEVRSLLQKHARVVHHPGLLKDDATIVVVRPRLESQSVKPPSVQE